jgi:hypothetical protein
MNIFSDQGEERVTNVLGEREYCGMEAVKKGVSTGLD